MLRNPSKKLLSVEQTRGCYDCCPREEQFISSARDEIPLEDVKALFTFLQGKVPDCLILEHPPRLSPEEAFSVIYYLQEIMHLLPDTYERCKVCGILFDSDYDGGSDETGCYCDYHLPPDEAEQEG